MESNASNTVNYYLSIPKSEQQYLCAIRHWEDLKVGFEEDTIWIKGLDFYQIQTVAVKSLPNIKIYTANQGQLFELEKLLPSTVIPEVLWTPMDIAFPIKLPAFNHNYFGLNQEIDVHLLPDNVEREVTSMLVKRSDLSAYIEQASSVRLANLRWVILSEKAFILGTPILPMPGMAYWQHKHNLFPAGFNLNLPNLGDHLTAAINPTNEFILWNLDGSYTILPMDKFEKLSISSFRKSAKLILS